MAVPLADREQIRLLPAPAYDPPYDDELPPERWGVGVVQPLLDLSAARDPRPVDDRAARRPPPRSGATPPTAAAATRFVNTCLEILNGYRPVTHFRVLAHPLEASAVLAEMTTAVRRLRQAAGRDALLRVRTMRTCQPRPDVTEIAVVIAAQPLDRSRTLPRPRPSTVDGHAAVRRASTTPVAPARRANAVPASPARRSAPPPSLDRRTGAAPAPVLRAGHAGRAAAPTVWALAYRLERRHAQWWCTAAHLL